MLSASVAGGREGLGRRDLAQLLGAPHEGGDLIAEAIGEGALDGGDHGLLAAVRREDQVAARPIGGGVFDADPGEDGDQLVPAHAVSTDVDPT